LNGVILLSQISTSEQRRFSALEPGDDLPYVLASSTMAASA